MFNGIKCTLDGHGQCQWKMNLLCKYLKTTYWQIWAAWNKIPQQEEHIAQQSPPNQYIRYKIKINNS